MNYVDEVIERTPIFSTGYTKEDPVSGYGLNGSVHKGLSLDALWPSTQDAFSLRKIWPTSHLLAAGRLYMLANGVAGCADGSLASRLALQSISDVFYRQSTHFSDTQADRTEQLKLAMWSTHNILLDWQEKLVCHRHEGGIRSFTGATLSPQLKQDRLCPFCGKHLIGLQASTIAVVAFAEQLSLVGMGDAAAFHFPASPEQPVTEMTFPPYPLGTPGLKPTHLHTYELSFSPGDRLLLINHGLLKLLQFGRRRADWQTELRQHLFGGAGDLSSAVPQLVQKLDQRARQYQPNAGQNLLHDLTLLTIAHPRTSYLKESRHKFQEAKTRQEQIATLENILFYENDRQLWHTYLSYFQNDLTPADTSPDNSQLTHELHQIINLGLREHQLDLAATRLIQFAETYPGKYVRHSDWLSALNNNISALKVLNRSSLPTGPTKIYYHLGDLAQILQSMAMTEALLRLAQQLLPDQPDAELLTRCRELLQEIPDLVTGEAAASIWEQQRQDAEQLLKAYEAWQQKQWSTLWQYLGNLQTLSGKDLQHIRQTYIRHLLTTLWALPPSSVQGQAEPLTALQNIPPSWLSKELTQIVNHWRTVWSSRTLTAAWAYLLTHPEQWAVSPGNTFFDWYHEQVLLELQTHLDPENSLDDPALHQLQQRLAEATVYTANMTPEDRRLYDLAQHCLTMWQSSTTEKWLAGWLAARQLAQNETLSDNSRTLSRNWQDRYTNKLYKWVFHLMAAPGATPIEQLQTYQEQLIQDEVLPDVQAILAGVIARQEEDQTAARQYIQTALQHIPPPRRHDLQQVAYENSYLNPSLLTRLFRRRNKSQTALS